MKAEVSSLSLSLAPLPLLRAHIYIIGLLFFFCCTWEEIESAKNGKRGEREERRGASECQENSVPRNYANSSKLPGQSVSQSARNREDEAEEEREVEHEAREDDRNDRSLHFRTLCSERE